MGKKMNVIINKLRCSMCVLWPCSVVTGEKRTSFLRVMINDRFQLNVPNQKGTSAEIRYMAFIWRKFIKRCLLNQTSINALMNWLRNVWYWKQHSTFSTIQYCPESVERFRLRDKNIRYVCINAIAIHTHIYTSISIVWWFSVCWWNDTVAGERNSIT